MSIKPEENIVHNSPGLKDEEPWIGGDWGTWAINIRGDVTINCGANQTITVDKMYGPLCAYPIRITLKYDKNCSGDWVVEYQNPTTEQWEIKAQWSCQENWPESEYD